MLEVLAWQAQTTTLQKEPRRSEIFRPVDFNKASLFQHGHRNNPQHGHLGGSFVASKCVPIAQHPGPWQQQTALKSARSPELRCPALQHSENPQVRAESLLPGRESVSGVYICFCDIMVDAPPCLRAVEWHRAKSLHAHKRSRQWCN